MTLGLRVSIHLDEWLIDPEAFSDVQRDEFAVAMISVLSVTLAILCIASVTGIPVSSTQLTVGCFVGVLFPINGLTVNYVRFSMLIGAWLVSPLVTFLLTLGLYYWIKKYIMLHKHPEKQSMKFLPFFISFSFTITLLFIMLEVF